MIDTHHAHTDRDHNHEITSSAGLTASEASGLLQQYGKNELPEKVVPKWYLFVSQLWQPMPVMIWVAALTEAAIQNWPDMAILLVIQFTNASIGFYEITKAGDAVAALKNSLKPQATVKRDGKWTTMDASLLVPGDLILVGAGSSIPADCAVNHGTIEVDQAALTGESLPVTMHKGDACKMGSTCVRGEVECTVQFTGANTFFGTTAAMLNGTQETGNLQKVLNRIMVVLVVVSLVLSFAVFGYLMASNDIGTYDSVSYTVVIIVASIPIAVEIVVTTTLALGSKELSKRGAIVTRLVAIEDLAGMNILCSDKTGTLTLNKMVIQEETPIYKAGETQRSLLRYAAMAAKWKEPPRDALDTLTLTAVDMSTMDTVEQLDYVPFDPVLKRTEGTIRDLASGQTYKTTKGAPHILMDLLPPEDEQIKRRCEADVRALGTRGVRALAVAKTRAVGGNVGDWELLGLLTFLDPPRPDTKDTLRQASEFGVEVKMITGDHLLIAVETAKMLDLGDEVEGSATVVPQISNAENLPMLDPVTKAPPKDMVARYGETILRGHGFAQVFPEHKYLIVKCLREMGYKVGMTGDGVNDAPALKVADVGIAVCGATDAARAASDIVFTDEGLSTIVDGIVIARCIFQRIQNFITYRISATLQLLVFFFISVIALHPNQFMPPGWEHIDAFDNEAWPNYFRMPVLMLMLITLLNDGTLISIGYDHVEPPNYPSGWNLPALFLSSSLLAGVSLVSSLVMLFVCLDSWNPHGVMTAFGLGNLSYGQIITAVYLKVSVSDFLTLFSSRTGGNWFWTVRPSPILLGAAVLALVLSTILALWWPESRPDGVYAVGLSYRAPKSLVVFVWVFCLVFWLLQDACKVALQAAMLKYNICGINQSRNTASVRSKGGAANAAAAAAAAAGAGQRVKPHHEAYVVSENPLFHDVEGGSNK